MDFEKLMQLPESSRDDQWERNFLQAAVAINVEVMEAGSPSHGPDGWPYLRVRTGRGEEPFLKIVRWLAGRGIGLTVNPHKMAPDYVFTYGMLWNFVETGRFIAPLSSASPGQADLTDRHIGPPTDSYLPPYARAVIGEFLGGHEIHPRVLVATNSDYSQTDLVFASESLGTLAPPEQKNFAEMIGWFLPLHYSVVFIAEDRLKGWVAL